MKNTIWILVLLALVGGAYYFGTQNKVAEPEMLGGTEIEGNVDDLISFSVKPGDVILGVLNFSGVVKNAYFFEANILVNILDQNKKLLKAGHGTATTEWMTTESVSFEGTIDITGLPPGPGYIQIANDNPSDMREYDMFIYIPVLIGRGIEPTK